MASVTNVRGFPFPAEIALLPGFTDTSWGNDVVDSVAFCANGWGFMVWIDAERPEDRTRDWGHDPDSIDNRIPAPHRYQLHRVYGYKQTAPEWDYSAEPFDSPLYEGDSDDSLLAAIAALGSLVTPDTVTADQLRGLLDHPDDHVRRMAHLAIANPADTEAMDECCSAINKAAR